MAKRRKNNEPMKPGTKFALTIAAVAILTGVTIKIVKSANKKQVEEVQ